MALGRKLVDHLQPYDIRSRWMSYHLAHLITAAETGKATTAERINIVRLILDLWVHRRDLPRHHGSDPFDDIRQTMAKLTDTSPWAHMHRRDLDHDEPDPVLTPVKHELAFSSGNTTDASETPEAAGAAETPESGNDADAGVTGAADDHPGDQPAPEAGLSADATELLALVRTVDMTTREAILRLLWMAAEQSRDASSEWLDLADRIKQTVESRATTTLRRHAELARRLRLTNTAVSDEDKDGDGDGDGDDDGQVEVEAVDWAEGVLAADPYGVATRADETTNLLADVTLAAELRRTAVLLTTVAQTLDDGTAEARRP